MQFQWRKPCACGECDKRTTMLEIGPFCIRYFNDFGDWFLYLYAGKRFWRFSNIGYLSGRIGP